jgi:hypothetical protein
MSTNSRKLSPAIFFAVTLSTRHSSFWRLTSISMTCPRLWMCLHKLGIVSSLHLFYEYSLLMRDSALDKGPVDSPWLCTLFQIERDGEEVRMKPGTFVYEGSARGDSPRPEEQLEHSAVSLSRDNFSENINRLLWERLNTRISEKDRITSRSINF